MNSDVKHLPYQSQSVRDLAWVMSSPGLLKQVPKGLGLVSDHWCLATYEACLDRLAGLDRNPAHLEQWLAERSSHRLGIYFESLLAYWLKNLLVVEELLTNVPVFSQRTPSGVRQTLGEFDFLFTLPGMEGVRHWEAAVKFYLRHRDASGEARWIGPGGKDRLDLKLDRMFSHQLKLSQAPEARSLLEGLGSGAVQCEAFIKGYLFYPLCEQEIFPDEALLSAEHLRGWWLRHGEFEIPQHNADSRWMVLPRRQWLSPVRRVFNDAKELLGRRAVIEYCQQHFTSSSEAVLFAELQYEGEDIWCECGRGFVVSENWPEKLS